MQQFLEETPGDADLEQALEENKVVLVKKRHRIKGLRNVISDLKAQRPHLAVATISSASAVTGGGDERGDTISTMAASMSLDTRPAPCSASNVAGGVSGTGPAAIAAPDATTPSRRGQEDEGNAREAGGGDVSGDDRVGVLL